MEGWKDETMDGWMDGEVPDVGLQVNHHPRSGRLCYIKGTQATTQRIASSPQFIYKERGSSVQCCAKGRQGVDWSILWLLQASAGQMAGISAWRAPNARLPQHRNKFFGVPAHHHRSGAAWPQRRSTLATSWEAKFYKVKKIKLIYEQHLNPPSWNWG